MSGILLPACSIFFSALLCIIYFSKKRINLLENKMYSIMIVSIVIDSILVTILQSFPLDGLSALEMGFVPLLNKIDFICLILFCNCLFFYTMLINIPKFKEKFNKYVIPFIILDAIVIIFILFTKVIAINSGGNYSVSGIPVYLTYILCLLYILLSIIIVLKNCRKKDRRHILLYKVIFIMKLILIILILIIFHKKNINLI